MAVVHARGEMVRGLWEAGYYGIELGALERLEEVIHARLPSSEVTVGEMGEAFRKEVYPGHGLAFGNACWWM